MLVMGLSGPFYEHHHLPFLSPSGRLARSRSHTKLYKMISAVCAVALAFSPSLSLQSRSMAAQSSRVATSDISMINLFGNNGELA